MQKQFERGICLFRRDLRIKHNAALYAATKECAQVIAIYQPQMELHRQIGVNQQWWLDNALLELQANLKDKQIKLFFLEPKADLIEVIKQFNATALFFNRQYLAKQLKLDQKLLKQCADNDISCFDFAGHLLIEPTQIANKSGQPYKVFTPFYKALLNHYQPPKILAPVAAQQSSLNVHRVKGVDTQNPWHGVKPLAQVAQTWQPTEAAAHKKLQQFCRNALQNYPQDRDLLAQNGTSRLSPYLHFGQLSPDQVWNYVAEHGNRAAATVFLRQLAWREFAWHLLYHFPSLEEQNFSPKFDRFAWEKQPKLLKIWQQGQTGYPVVDAAMNELLNTGFMHNRARMVVASFLAKDLLIDWREGEAWFWQHLVDADEANNVIGWQWVAGCGPDPSPFVRIFNPILQGKKFDPEGLYIKHWLPQLKKLPNKFLYAPWLAKTEILALAKIELGKDYQQPIIDHQKAAKRALHSYKIMKK